MINKLKDLKRNYRSDHQPIKAILDRKEKTFVLDYGSEGNIKIYLKDIEKRPKTIFDCYFLFLYLTKNQRPSNANETDIKRLNEYLENILKVEQGSLKESYVYTNLKGGKNKNENRNSNSRFKQVWK